MFFDVIMGKQKKDIFPVISCQRHVLSDSVIMVVCNLNAEWCLFFRSLLVRLLFFLSY